MTNKVTMPEPVGKSMYLLDEVGNLVPTGYTPDQMEAYAEARVREALEEAANVALDAPITAGMEANEGALALSIHANSRIRALIPATK